MGKQQQELLAKRHQQRQKSNPKLVLDGDNRVVIFEERPRVIFTQAALTQLMADAELKDGKYRTNLIAVEIIDGQATMHFGKVEE